MAEVKDVLQKVDDYCTEKQYTLDDSFRSQFSEKFVGANADADVNDENVLKSIKFNLDTAFSATSKGIKSKEETWKQKEADYLKQIEEAKKSSKGDVKPPKVKGESELPEEVMKKLEELDKFKSASEKQEKRAEILAAARRSVREDLHDELSDILDMMTIDYTKDSKALADELSAKVTKIFKNKIGDVRPKSAESKSKRMEDIIGSVGTVKI